MSYGPLGPAYCSLLSPPIPRRLRSVRMHAEPVGLRLGLLADIVAAVPHERPGKPLAHHDGAQILAVSSADGDRAAVAVAVLLLADD